MVYKTIEISHRFGKVSKVHTSLSVYLTEELKKIGLKAKDPVKISLVNDKGRDIILITKVRDKT